MSKERRLGRGLEALLGRSYGGVGAGGYEGGDPVPASASMAVELPAVHGAVDGGGDVTRSADGQQWLAVAAIDRNPYQPRQTFDEAEIADLCDSIRTHGFLQPIVVRRFDGGYQLIAGERRLRAAQMAGWERIPVQIREVADRQMAELAIVENVQRKDLNPIEKAASFRRYMEEYNATHEELSARVNVDRSTITNLLRLLDLPEEIQLMISRNELSAGHARALLPLGDDVDQVEFARKIQKEALSVRATESAVAEHVRRFETEPLSIVDIEGMVRKAPIQPGYHLREMETDLGLALGTRVEIRQSAKGRGRITIQFASNEEFERLRTFLKQAPPVSGAM